MLDICCIGHITLDRIVTPEKTASLNGGTSYYVSHAISKLPPIGYKLVTSLAQSEMGAVEEMRAAGIDVEVIPSKNTVFFENTYGANMNNRTQRVLAKADPFSPESLKHIYARYIHLGSLLADDFSIEVMKELKGHGILSVDAQGFLRYVDGDKVYPCPWQNKLEAFKYIDILKVNEHEIESLTGYTDLHMAARQFDEWGIKEVLMTLGSYGSVIFVNGEFYEIPAYKPLRIEDATGCGDTYAAGYLYSRSKGAGYVEAGKFAAAMCTLKIEHTGPFDRSIDDIQAIID
ncbi:MAG: PfkB family carbohydrate kinase [Muribaculaceae bacterium]